MNGNLVLYKPILPNHRYIALIIVPQYMRSSVFSRLHAGPIGGHMGEYKTLYRMRLWLFWPRLREYVKKWVKGCALCILYNIWRTRNQELYFSWSVTIQFYIIYLNMWSPGAALHNIKE